MGGMSGNDVAWGGASSERSPALEEGGPMLRVKWWSIMSEVHMLCNQILQHLVLIHYFILALPAMT